MKQGIEGEEEAYRSSGWWPPGFAPVEERRWCVGEAPVVALSQKMHGGIGYAGIGWWWVESSSSLRWMVSPEKGCGRRVGALLIETAWVKRRRLGAHCCW
ncbi:hypothetical protein U1Q18_003469 [Sarracenia purpurea var. burkii]